MQFSSFLFLPEEKENKLRMSSLLSLIKYFGGLRLVVFGVDLAYRQTALVSELLGNMLRV